MSVALKIARGQLYLDPPTFSWKWWLGCGSAKKDQPIPIFKFFELYLQIFGREEHLKTNHQVGGIDSVLIESVWFTKLYLGYRLTHLMVISFSWFERLTMTVILFNCVTLGMYQPCEDGNCETQRCKVLKVRFFFVLQMRTSAPITEIMSLLTKSSKGLLLYPSYLH